MIKNILRYLKRPLTKRKAHRLTVTNVSDIKAGDKIHVIGTDGAVKVGKVKRINEKEKYEKNT